MMGAEAAADALGMDRRTVRGWLSKAPEPDDAEAWTAAQQLAQQQLTERLAAGKVTNPVTLATVAGIASRNVRYARVIAERTAGKADEKSKPDAETRLEARLPRLDDLRKRYLRTALDVEIRRRAQDEEAEPEPSVSKRTATRRSIGTSTHSSRCQMTRLGGALKR